MVASGEVSSLTAPEDRIGGYAGQTIPATDYLRALRIRAKLGRVLDAWFAPYDAVLTVPTAETAPSASSDFDGKFHSKSLGGPGNACGTPAIVLPTGLSDSGLPTAIQLDGRAYSENRLLALANAFQRATTWHTARPDLDKAPGPETKPTDVEDR